MRPSFHKKKKKKKTDLHTVMVQIGFLASGNRIFLL